MGSLDTWAYASVGVQWLVYASSLLAAGGVWYLASHRALPEAVYRSTVRVSLFSAILAVVATLLRVCLQAGSLIDEGWAGMVDPDMLALAVDGSLGSASWTRLGGLVLVMTLPSLPGRHLPWLPIVGAIAVAFSFTLTGHATSDPGSWHALLLTVHLVAASFWIGALWPLSRLAHNTADLPAAGRACEQFGRDAALAVALLLGVGVALAWFLTGSIDALIGTAYGATLLVKVALVGLLLGLAAANKWRFVPSLCGADQRVAGRAAHRLRHTIAVEALLFQAILLTTAILTGAMTLPGL